MASQRKRSTGRESLRSSISYGRDARPSVGASASKIPRSTPLLHSSRKILPSATKSASKRSYFSSSDHHFMKDPRPVSDKSQMRKCINDIIQTLAEYGYPHTLTLKMMSPPTNKEYFRIVEYVYRLISPGYEMITRPDEETAKILSDLGYPISISKSTLNNIGAMSAWPNALAALDWLLDLVKLYKASEETVADALFGEDMKRPAMYDYLRATYGAFMHGENAPFRGLDEALEQRIEEMSRDQANANEKMERKCDEIKAEMHLLNSEKNAILEMELEKSRIETLKQNLEKYFEDLVPYFANLEQRRNATLKQISDVQESISLLERERSGIESTISGQELSVSDLKRMEISVSEIETKIRSTEERTNQAQERFYEKQIQESKLNDKINSQVAEYMEVCQTLDVLDSHGGGDVDFTLTSDRSDIDKNDGKLHSIIRPKAMEIKSSLLKENGQLQNMNRHSHDMLEQLDEEITDKKHTLESLQKQIEGLEEEEKRVHEEFQKKEEKENREVAELEEAIRRQKVVNNLSVDDAREILDAERKCLKETETRVEKQAEDCHNSFKGLHEKCLGYQIKMDSLLRDLNKNTALNLQQFSAKMQQQQAIVCDHKKHFEETSKKLRDLEQRFSDALSD